MANVSVSEEAVRDLQVPKSVAWLPKPFSFDPVLARIDGTVIDIARRLGVDRQRIYRWMQTGLDDIQADVIASRLDVHPSVLWENWFDIDPVAWDPLGESIYDDGPLKGEALRKATVRLTRARGRSERLARLADEARGEGATYFRLGECRGADSNLFFPERGEDTSLAKSICKDCPVRKGCLEYALANVERQGIWGGTSERERRQIRRTYKGKNRDSKVS
jgi:hypothetical protein